MAILDTIERQKQEKQKRFEEMQAQVETRKMRQAVKPKKLPKWKELIVSYTARFLAWLVK